MLYRNTRKRFGWVACLRHSAIWASVIGWSEPLFFDWSARAGWTAAVKEGEAFIALARSVVRSTASAQRIYSITSDPWRGRWQLLFPTDVPDTLRDDLRRSLHWLGFRAISPGAYARPGGDLGSVRDLLDEFSLEKGVIVMDGVSSPVTSKNELKRTVNKHWELDKLAEDYASLIKRFRPLNQVLEKGTSPPPQRRFGAATIDSRLPTYSTARHALTGRPVTQPLRHNQKHLSALCIGS